MCVDENLTSRLRLGLTAVAELTLLVSSKRFATGPEGHRLRGYFDHLVSLCEEANDAISKENYSPTAARAGHDSVQPLRGGPAGGAQLVRDANDSLGDFGRVNRRGDIVSKRVGRYSNTVFAEGTDGSRSSVPLERGSSDSGNTER